MIFSASCPTRFPMASAVNPIWISRETWLWRRKSKRLDFLRHSHVAYLINKGIEPILIKERVGHKDIRITLNTYGHLYPNQQRKVADMLDFEKKALTAATARTCDNRKTSVIYVITA